MYYKIQKFKIIYSSFFLLTVYGSQNKLSFGLL